MIRERSACEESPSPFAMNGHLEPDRIAGDSFSTASSSTGSDEQSISRRFSLVSLLSKTAPALTAKYEARYRQFRQIYPACKELFAALQYGGINHAEYP